MEIIVKGYISQVVQVAEHADLAKLRNSGEHGELYAAVHGLQCSVEAFQRAAVLLLQFFIAYGLQQWFIVFIHEDDHALTCLLVSALYYSLETCTERALCLTFAIYLLILL